MGLSPQNNKPATDLLQLDSTTPSSAEIDSLDLNMDTQSHINSDDNQKVDLVWLCREGEVELILYLLEKAVSSKNKLPTQYKNIAWMSIQLQRKWREVCLQEIEILKQCKIYKLVSLSKEAKMVKNRWVFAIKSDGHKKAYLVAKPKGLTTMKSFPQLFDMRQYAHCLQLQLSKTERSLPLTSKVHFFMENLMKPFIWNNCKDL